MMKIVNRLKQTCKCFNLRLRSRKEKLYTVEIPNPHGLGHTVLVKDMYGNIFITYVMNSDWRKSKVNQLTEAEIKKDFDWAWPFVEEV